jgi:hypothetical protein
MEMPIAVQVTLLIFLAGVIFAGGRLSARVDELERKQNETHEDVRAIRAMLDRIDGAIEHRRSTV